MKVIIFGCYKKTNIYIFPPFHIDIKEILLHLLTGSYGSIIIGNNWKKIKKPQKLQIMEEKTVT